MTPDLVERRIEVERRLRGLELRAQSAEQVLGDVEHILRNRRLPGRSSACVPHDSILAAQTIEFAIDHPEYLDNAFEVTGFPASGQLAYYEDVESVVTRSTWLDRYFSPGSDDTYIFPTAAGWVSEAFELTGVIGGAFDGFVFDALYGLWACDLTFPLEGEDLAGNCNYVFWFAARERDAAPLILPPEWMGEFGFFFGAEGGALGEPFALRPSTEPYFDFAWPFTILPVDLALEGVVLDSWSPYSAESFYYYGDSDATVGVYSQASAVLTLTGTP